MNLSRILQDIHLEDVSLKTQYYNYFLNGEIDNAKVIANRSSLNSKVLNAENLNNLVNGILELEQNLYTNVDDYLSTKVNQYQISVDELVYMNEFSETTQYEINNFVLYNDKIYFCKANPTIGTLPTNTTYWLCLGLKGENGYYASGVLYKGLWDSAINYVSYNMIIYEGLLYVSKTNNTNINPSTDDGTNWYKLEIEKQSIYFSETEPNDIPIGGIWFKILT
jgi:hypothetical protein